MYTTLASYLAAMPKRVSDDVDHVPADPKPSKIPKKKPPPPGPPPEHTPILISNPLLHGHSQLPTHIRPDDAYGIFCLFFSEDVLCTLRDHTNQYAELYPGPADKPFIRDWWPTTVKELRAYIGVYIWMGLHRETAIEDFWNTNPKNGPIHDEVRKHIGLKRWEQIDRFFHVSLPHLPNEPDEKESLFEKLEPLNESLRQAFKRHWATGTHLAVDESIQRFMGRAVEIVNIPSKPTPEGFKIWILANAGYVLDWLYHAKGDRLGPIDLDDFWTDNLGFSKTQAVVLDLVTQQGVLGGFHHIIWLDNLFTSARLLRQLKLEGFGAAGTVRTSKTVRETIEESEGSTQQRNVLPKEHNRGVDPLLSALKLDHAMQLPWGELYLASDGEVLQAAWKDQNVVLFMSTVSNGIDQILRPRKRPGTTSTNAKTSRKVFGNQTIKELLIPKFINDYNHYMGAVDQADQSRSYFNTQRIHRKTWKPLWHFLLDTTITNCFKIHRHRPPGAIDTSPQWSQKKFRTELANGLFAHSERLTKPVSDTQQPLIPYVIPDVASEHHHVVLSQKIQPCRVCRLKRRRPIAVMKRKPLTELSHNINNPNGVKKRKQKLTRTKYGCDVCSQYICRGGSCWSEHLEDIH